MNGLQRFNEIIQYFRDEGYNDEQLAKVYDAIGKAAYDKFVSDTMEHLTEEDMVEIEKLTSDDAVADEVKRRYEMRTGKKAEDRMNLHLTTAAEIYLAHHERDIAKKTLEEEKNDSSPYAS